MIYLSSSYDNILFVLLCIRVTAKGKEINDWSIFTAVELGLSKFAFISHQGKYLSADPTMKWGKVVANRLLMTKWESFQLVLSSN